MRLRTEIFQRLIWCYGEQHSIVESEPGWGSFVCRKRSRGCTEGCCCRPSRADPLTATQSTTCQIQNFQMLQLTCHIPYEKVLHNLIGNSLLMPILGLFKNFNSNRKLHIKCCRIDRKSAEFQGVVLIFFYSSLSLKVLKISPMLNSAGLFHRENLSFIFFTVSTEQIQTK